MFINMKKEDNLSDKILMNYIDMFHDMIIKNKGVLFNDVQYTFSNDMYELIVSYSNGEYKKIQSKDKILNYLENVLRIFDKHSGAPYIKDLEHLNLKKKKCFK